MYQKSLFTKPPAPKPPKKRLIRFALWTAFKRMLMALGALVLVSSVISAVMMARVLNLQGDMRPPPLPDAVVLYLPLEDGFAEHERMFLPYGLGQGGVTIRAAVNALDRAATDPRVKGLIVDLKSDGGGNLAHFQELRAAVLRFRAAGKFAYIYGASYGGPGRGLGLYYLTSAFEEIWMQPMGQVSIAGIRAEVPFFRAALHKIGVQPQFFARKEYKTLFESANNTQMSPQNREMIRGLVDDIAGQLTAGIAEGRSIEPKKMKALVDHGLYMDREALDAGLVDYLGDYETLRAKILADVTGQPDARGLFYGLDDYAQKTAAPPHTKQKATVALVYIQGAIMAEGHGEDFTPADEIADIISDAADDKNIQTIVLRIDSPGGSPEASETIRLAVLRAKVKGKKVVVSMGATAASGAYWVAASADRIFALPGTLTGSIGVAGGKVSLRDMWSKAGVNWDGVQYGANAGLWSFNEPFSQSGAALMNNSMDTVYNGFVARVAEGRGMTPAAVDKVAGGRVWSGRQALDKGLVDELGGLDHVLDYVAQEQGVGSRAALGIVVLPRPLNPLQKFRELLQSQVRIGQEINALMQSYSLILHGDELSVMQPLMIR